MNTKVRGPLPPSFLPDQPSEERIPRAERASVCPLMTAAVAQIVLSDIAGAVARMIVDMHAQGSPEGVETNA